MPFIPAPVALWSVLAAAMLATGALWAGWPRAALMSGALVGLTLLLLAMGCDYALSAKRWRRAAVRGTRRLPQAFAIGVPSSVQLCLAGAHAETWQMQLHDDHDAAMIAKGLPAEVALQPGLEASVPYVLIPLRRGQVEFRPVQLRIHSRWRLCVLLRVAAERETRRVLPDFAQVARYAWLASDRRLAELGIKSWQRRGTGTDFKQLTEYQPGDDTRRIDWRATLRANRPIVRDYQDERDQCVQMVLDCGRRMRAEEPEKAGGHFDAVLNALTLLAHVALVSGDAVGAQTFAVPHGSERFLPARKGKQHLGALVAGLYDQQPTLEHPDYLQAATQVMARLRRRSLVVLLTNFRDADGEELSAALRLLRTRHVVLLANVREPLLREMAEQPLIDNAAMLQVAAAHQFEQSRRAAFLRLARHDALMVDAEPKRLAVELVNRYDAAKKAGVL